MSSGFGSSFAPYAPPPDDPSHHEIATPQAPSQSPAAQGKFARPWFPVHASSQYIEPSYQSGAVPTWGASGGSGPVQDVETAQQNQWETTHGMRVDVLAALAYLFGPASALIILIIERHNDYVRFHAYQSALLATPLLIIRMLASLIGFSPWLRTFLTSCIVIPSVGMAIKAYLGVQDGLVHYQLPYIGPIAEDWLASE